MEDSIIDLINEAICDCLRETGINPKTIYVSKDYFEDLVASGQMELRRIHELACEGWAPLGRYFQDRRIVFVTDPRFVGVGL